MPKVKSDTIHARIRTVRQGKGLSVYRLAQLTGLDQSFLGRLEKGATSVGWPAACRIADALGVPLGELRGKDD